MFSEARCLLTQDLAASDILDAFSCCALLRRLRTGGGRSGYWSGGVFVAGFGEELAWGVGDERFSYGLGSQGRLNRYVLQGERLREGRHVCGAG